MPTDDTLYVIAHVNGLHAVQLGPGQEMVTGQNKVEEYEDEQAWRERLNDLGYEWPEDPA